jgi:hypothetical protein
LELDVSEVAWTSLGFWEAVSVRCVEMKKGRWFVRTERGMEQLEKGKRGSDVLRRLNRKVPGKYPGVWSLLYSLDFRVAPERQIHDYSENNLYEK